jgi:hypothetical protein
MLALKLLHIFEFRSADEFSVKAVGPAMITTAKYLARTTPFSWRTGAVAAHVVKTPKPAIESSNQQQRLAKQFGSKEVPRFGKLIVMPYNLPTSTE